MSTPIAHQDDASRTAQRAASENPNPIDPWENGRDAARRVLQPFASLRLTVILFSLAIFLIFAGTLAQAQHDIWYVMKTYFRTPIAWIDLDIFCHPLFYLGEAEIPLTIPFPGGWLIGSLMLINLLAAHTMRFKSQTQGVRLKAGLGVIALGTLFTTLFIVGLQDVMQWLFTSGIDFSFGGSTTRILFQLALGTLAGVVLLAGCVMVFKKRAGIVLLHAGVGLLMLSELITGLTATEGVMSIGEGQTVNFARDLRAFELAVVDRSGEDEDQVVVVPADRLEVGEVISHDYLPFDIKTLKYLPNSRLRPVKNGDETIADTGFGTRFVAEPTPITTGADTGGEVDEPAAYVEFLEKETGESLGKYLLGAVLARQEMATTVAVDGETYETYLRFKRMHKPYSINLQDVRADKYLGTEKVKNYSSDIRLVDPDRSVDREAKIWMNNPLRYGGETFYQSSYHLDPRTGQEFTGLQIVDNAGWMIPYVACMIVVTGMIYHFTLTLVRFQRRRSEQRTALRPAGTRTIGPLSQWVFPIAVVGLVAISLGYAARRPSTPEGAMRLEDFGKLPVVYQGRVKPLDTLARNSLRIISDKQTFEDESGETQPAIRWLLDVVADPQSAVKHRVFRIQSLDLLDTLELPRRDGFRYAIEEFEDQISVLDEQSRRAASMPSDERGVYQKQVLQLARKLQLYLTLREANSVIAIRPGHEREDLMVAARQVMRLREGGTPLPHTVPPTSKDEQWQPLIVGSLLAQIHAEPQVAARSQIAMLMAYNSDNPKEFNTALNDYETWLAENPPTDYSAQKHSFETFFNHLAPFYQGMWMYVLTFILAALSWLGWSRPLGRAALCLLIVTFVLHTLALIARIYISGRPPVTNLYSSAVFIGWACVAFGLVLEFIYRLNIGTAVAAATGFATLLVAHFLSGDGDTMEVLQAVLDTNFWLATHVVCITLGYATTFMAGFLAIAYIFAGVFTRAFSSPEIEKTINRMIYGTLCFAILFSFFGTVLGGLWADDSWGRFWGWDPKENGALIIVLWNALILHARWGGLVAHRGLAALAVVGNIVTCWSWFGVNELGVGLHSYGFTEGTRFWLALFVASQLAIIALTFLPHTYWSSHRNRAKMA